MSVPASKSGIWGRWCSYPLYARILVGLILGLIVGSVAGESAIHLEIPAKVILQLLQTLAPPLILVAVVQVLFTTHIQGNKAVRLGWLLFLNTTVAILIGLAVANLVQPGRWSGNAEFPASDKVAQTYTPIELVLANLPRSILGPLGDNHNIIGVIFIAIALGLSLRSAPVRLHALANDMIDLAYHCLLTVLHCVIQLVPFGVFAIVAKTVGIQGFGAFVAMGGFVFAVLLALGIQCVWYLTRIRLFSWVKPFDAVKGVRDAIFVAFSTSSSTIAMPLTYDRLKTNVGLRDESASLGSLVGANFNNDGTALYEAMSALFIAQLIGQHLSPWEQFLIVITSIVASVGAAGIPEAGLVTMTLVFTAVGLPVEYIALLLTVDWFLDRCRTVINLLGDVNTSCLLDGFVPKSNELAVEGALPALPDHQPHL